MIVAVRAGALFSATLLAEVETPSVRRAVWLHADPNPRRAFPHATPAPFLSEILQRSFEVYGRKARHSISNKRQATPRSTPPPERTLCSIMHSGRLTADRVVHAIWLPQCAPRPAAAPPRSTPFSRPQGTRAGTLLAPWSLRRTPPRAPFPVALRRRRGSGLSARMIEANQCRRAIQRPQSFYPLVLDEGYNASLALALFPSDIPSISRCWRRPSGSPRYM